MLYFGKEVGSGMALVGREPDRLLFSSAQGDLAVVVEAGQPTVVAVVTTHWPAAAQEFLQQQAEPLQGIIHYQTESGRTPQAILDQARAYFGEGPEGLGLAVTAEGPGSLHFVGGGGQVTVAAHRNGQSQVQVAAREWNYHAERFVRQVSSER